MLAASDVCVTLLYETILPVLPARDVPHMDVTELLARLHVSLHNRLDMGVMIWYVRMLYVV
jgi:hypothetical protein